MGERHRQACARAAAAARVSPRRLAPRSRSDWGATPTSAVTPTPSASSAAPFDINLPFGTASPPGTVAAANSNHRNNKDNNNSRCSSSRSSTSSGWVPSNSVKLDTTKTASRVAAVDNADAISTLATEPIRAERVPDRTTATRCEAATREAATSVSHANTINLTESVSCHSGQESLLGLSRRYGSSALMHRSWEDAAGAAASPYLTPLSHAGRRTTSFRDYGFVTTASEGALAGSYSASQVDRLPHASNAATAAAAAAVAGRASSAPARCARRRELWNGLFGRSSSKHVGGTDPLTYRESQIEAPEARKPVTTTGMFRFDDPVRRLLNKALRKDE